ncbi:hypothetical protein F2Q69_00036329 [Brassica cretica]|uniref:Uncharacterized protein n=1 Tax=Brassica cretica TaxID=69181 RepID=A0A8S9SM64_BRACR|nr:hypothetical protein F2Q69_00036329 [Brassica cretica]
MHVLQMSGQSVSRDRVVEEMTERRSTVHPLCLMHLGSYNPRLAPYCHGPDWFGITWTLQVNFSFPLDLCVISSNGSRLPFCWTCASYQATNWLREYQQPFRNCCATVHSTSSPSEFISKPYRSSVPILGRIKWYQRHSTGTIYPSSHLPIYPSYFQQHVIQEAE